MGKRYTILVTSDSHSQTKTWTISALKLRFLFFVTTIFLIFCAAILADYFGLLLEESENKQLKAKNAILREQFEHVENTILDLENSLERVSGFSAKLRLLVESENDNRNLQLSMNDTLRETPPSERVEKKNVSQILSSKELRPKKIPPGKFEIYRYNPSNKISLVVSMERLAKDFKWVEKSSEEMLGLLKGMSFSTVPTLSPVNSGWLVDEFGYRRDPHTQKPVMHFGVTLAAERGSPVRATADGKVSYVGFDENLGKVVAIDHSLGLKTRYAYVSEIDVELGQFVKKQERIAKVGGTGRAQGPSVYYEVLLDGIPVNPSKFILAGE